MITVPYASSVMRPNLEPGPLRIILVEDQQKKSSLSRGQIVYYELHETDQAGRPPGNYVSRIIGLPGEKVSVRKSIVYIDGNPLKEDYEIQNEILNVDVPEKQVPDNSYLLMTDVRPTPFFIVNFSDVIGIIYPKNRSLY